MSTPPNADTYGWSAPLMFHPTTRRNEMAKFMIDDAVSVELNGKRRKAKVVQVPTDDRGAVLVETTEGEPFVSTFVAWDDLTKGRAARAASDGKPDDDDDKED